MFKSMFSKYLIAFISIILISFLMISAIVTSMIRSYVTDEKENQLYKTTLSIVDHLSGRSVESISSDIKDTTVVVTMLINLDKALDVMITDENGKVLLSSLPSKNVEDGETRTPVTKGDLGKINIA